MIITFTVLLILTSLLLILLVLLHKGRGGGLSDMFGGGVSSGLGGSSVAERNLDPTAPGYVAIVEPTPTTLVVQRDAEGDPVSLTLLAAPGPGRRLRARRPARCP